MTVLRSRRTAPGRDPRDAGIARVALVLGAVAVLAAGGTGVALLAGSGGSLTGTPGPTPTPAPPVVAAVKGATGTTVPWNAPLTFSVTDGTLRSVDVQAVDGTALPGTLAPTSWVSTSTLVPATTYRLHAVVDDARGRTSAVDRVLKATPAAHVLHANISPAGGTYGIGQPVIVRFDQRVSGVAARSAVLQRLSVTTAPAVEGAWHWYNSTEVHYRAREYWKPGTTITVTASLGGLRVPGTDVWGAAKPVTSGYAIGRALVATVDVTAHVMTVTIDGRTVRTVKVSTGRDKYPTKGGVHVVLVRQAVQLYDSSTVGIPTASPDGYYEKLPWSVRISNGGAFVHANPATTRVQGIANVSHGC
ncbi:MAG: Ig-like domain-containing protein, partial [Mycobacteriales bacterium]